LHQFIAQNRDVPRGLNADLYVVTLDRKDDHLNFVTDPDALLSFPAQDEHAGSWRSS
jgi:hypothetical protein